ncbi:hypothetical protein BKA00_001579 [Actinomadura coerulea]|uniref:DUF885 domain-containing protein n=1 Tax=Actinomadura coerulea TaxID=46159 RepID=A0A7X0KXT0_9ACTN|nr:DUF885 domain-containing protein [Actinomadura coerulea]MBB6394665.1 hypothetical protein [Actinomadura coerulea]GGQ36792.1 hypothetical protein GCM10010187_62910 [Actinomadura coerulea]
MREEVVTEYLSLGLRFGRLADGFVDSWYGDPELSRRVDAEPRPDASGLAAQSADLLAALADSGLAEPRRRFLSAQLAALNCAARRMAGEEIPFRDEVRTYFEVDIEPGEPDRYAEIHDAIGALLPGPGDLRARTAAFYERNAVPPERLARAVQAVSDELRAMTRTVFGLPERESVEYVVVRDKPWNAYNRYLGGFRSRVELNAEAGRTIAALPLLAIHEAYPGHHTEHCRKEAGLVDGAGHGEHLISLVNTPQCLMAEGTAEMADAAVPGPGWGRWTAGILADAGVRVEGELVEEVLRLIRLLMPARQDAALMLHDRGADPDEVTGYLERWLLVPPDHARRMTRFLTDPLWRAYSVTYIEGPRLVGAWLDAGTGGTSLVERYRRLLDEPLLPSDLRADLEAADPPGVRTGAR